MDSATENYVVEHNLGRHLGEEKLGCPACQQALRLREMEAEPLRRLVVFAEGKNAEVTIAREVRDRPEAPLGGGQWAVMLSWEGGLVLSSDADVRVAIEKALDDAPRAKPPEGALKEKLAGRLPR